VEARGFELAQASKHMIVWLGRGDNVASFVCDDVEAEIQRQTPDAVVESVTLKSEPDLQTSAKPTGQQGEAVVTGLQATFPVAVVVRRADGARWQLSVDLRYILSNVSETNRELRLDFQVVAAVQA